MEVDEDCIIYGYLLYLKTAFQILKGRFSIRCKVAM